MIISLAQFFLNIEHLIYAYFYRHTFGSVQCHVTYFPLRDVIRCVFRFRSPF